MSSQIKIVYNWIGQWEPLINTEIPSIASIAQATWNIDAVKLKTVKKEDVFRYIFQGDTRFQISPTFDVLSTDMFIYPLQMGYRIDWKKLFWHKDGLLEWGNMPEHILHWIQDMNGYCLIDAGYEAWVNDHTILPMHSYFQNQKIPLHKIIYLTNCGNAKLAYENVCKRNNIPYDQRINILTFSTSQANFSNYLMDPKVAFFPPKYDTTTVPSKLFLMWNRRFKIHRTIPSLILDKLGLADRSYISMPLLSDETGGSFTDSIDEDAMSWFGITDDTLTNFTKKLPLELDKEKNVSVMMNGFDNATRFFYTDSLISIITETNFYEEEISVTEKSLKPLKEKHPFIIIGSCGVLKSLRELGFKTFGEFWDESYDSEPDAWCRLKKIMQVCEDIGKWDNDKILKFKSEVKDTLDHNFKILKINPKYELQEKIISIIKGNV